MCRLTQVKVGGGNSIRRRVCSNAAVFTLSLLLMGEAIAQSPAPVAGGSRDTLNAPFPYIATEAPLRRILADVTRQTGISVRVDEAVRGDVSVRNPDGSILRLLDDAVSQAQAIWWFDGMILHVESMQNVRTALVDPAGLSLRQIEDVLTALDLSDGRYPMRTTQGGSVIRVTGPGGYVEQVTALITALVQSRIARTVGGTEEIAFYLPRIYHGRPL